VVEVTQDNKYPATLRAECVFDRNADVIKGDKGCARSWRVGRLYRLGCDAFLPGDENDCQTVLPEHHTFNFAVRTEM
jgi:hypothetical protein